MRTKALILLACVLVLAGLAGCADTTKAVKGAGGGTTTLQILHLSDLHIGKTKTVERDNLIEIVKKIEGKWGGEANKPVVLITGDISNDGEVDQFDKAREILDPLYKSGFQLLIVPGNHDYGPVGSLVQLHRYAHFKDKFFPGQEVAFPLKTEIGGQMMIGLNSLEGHEHSTDKVWADGKLGDEQIDKVDQILKDWEKRKPEQKVIVYLHHHPFLYPGQPPAKNAEEMIGHWLDDGDKFMHKISGRIDILLFGHEHWHLDLSGTKLSRKYGIPIILSAGKSTDETTKEYKVDDKGKADKDNVLNQGLLGRLITIQDDGTVKVETVKF